MCSRVLAVCRDFILTPILKHIPPSGPVLSCPVLSCLFYLSSQSTSSLAPNNLSFHFLPLAFHHLLLLLLLTSPLISHNTTIRNALHHPRYPSLLFANLSLAGTNNLQRQTRGDPAPTRIHRRRRLGLSLRATSSWAAH